VTLKVVLEATCDPESPPGMYTEENLPMREKESKNSNLMWLSEYSSELVF
jgi:hypothetical protein